MARRLPQDFIEEVRTKTDIADVISPYVKLKKSGKNLFGLCPFHTERTGSFSVAEDKQIYHCFSCGRGGNVFNFIMEIENISFPEAVVKVAQTSGIAIPDSYGDGSKNTESSLEEQLLKLYDEANELFHHILLKTDTGSNALDYLKHREISPEIIETYSIGFAPDKSDFLLAFFKQKNVSDDLLHESGLFSENEDGQLFDRFRDRVMFPIRDQNGRIIAFSGRILSKKEGTAKYLNSPETKIFNKSKILFNYDIAKKETRNSHELVLFEGFMDVISAYQAGLKYGVASMGTSLTEQQIYLLKRITDRLIVCYDGDDAGQNATQRVVNLLKNKDMDLGVVTLPQKMDPDEYIKSRGAENFNNVLKNGVKTVIAFEFNNLSQKYNLNNERDQIEFLDEALKKLVQVDSAVETDIYIKKLSDKLSIDIDAIRQQFSTIRREMLVKNPPADFGSPKSQKGYTNLTATVTEKESKLEIAEQNLLYLCLRFEDVYNKIMNLQGFAFVHEKYNRIMGIWGDNANFDMTISQFLDLLPEDLQAIIAKLEMKNLPNDYEDDEVDDYIKVIFKNSLIEQYKKACSDLKEAQAENDMDSIIKLTSLIIKLKNELSL